MWSGPDRAAAWSNTPATALSAAALGAVAAGAAAGPAVDADGPTLCPLKLAAGVPCPFCGLTRSLLALGQADVGRAFELHPLGLVVPLAAAWVLLAVIRSARGRSALALPRPALVLGAVMFAAAWIVQLERGVA